MKNDISKHVVSVGSFVPYFGSEMFTFIESVRWTEISAYFSTNHIYLNLMHGTKLHTKGAKFFLLGWTEYKTDNGETHYSVKCITEFGILYFKCRQSYNVFSVLENIKKL